MKITHVDPNYRPRFTLVKKRGFEAYRMLEPIRLEFEELIEMPNPEPFPTRFVIFLLTIFLAFIAIMHALGKGWII